MRHLVERVDGDLPLPGIAHTVAVHVLERDFADGEHAERLRPVPIGDGRYLDGLTFRLAEHEPVGFIEEPDEHIIVRPINSVRKYDELDQDPLAAGRELEVESVLEGSLQRSGEYIRVRVRLVTVADGATLWAGTFDEPFTNIFAVQDAIAERVAGALAPHLGYEEKRRLTKRYTANAEAYELYARGRYHALKPTPPEIQTAICYFQQAIDLDPSYALAHVGLADSYRSLPLNSDLPPDEFFARA